MEKLFLFILNRSISAGWLILAVIVLRLFLKRAPRRIVCFLWILAAVRLLIPFSPESTFSLIPSRDTFRIAETAGEDSGKKAADAPAGTTGLLVHTGFEGLDSAIGDLLEGNNLALPETGEPKAMEEGRDSFPAGAGYSLKTVSPVKAEEDPGVSSSLLGLLSCIWLAGTTFILAGAGISYLLLKRRVRISVERTPGVRLCDAIDTPFILGFLSPKICLPSGLNGEEKEYVLAHERAHLESRDHWRKGIGYVLLAVYWINPLVWIGYALFCRDTEIACDERVIEGKDLAYRKAYAMALLSCSAPGRRIVPCPLAFGEVGVKERIQSVLRYHKPAVWITAAGVILCGIVLVCFLTDPESGGEDPGQGAVDQSPQVSMEPWVGVKEDGSTDETPMQEEQVLSSASLDGAELSKPGVEDFLRDTLFDDWESAYHSLYQVWMENREEEETLFVQLHDFDSDRIPEMMLLDGAEMLHIYSYSAEDKRTGTVSEMPVAGAVYCWGNVIAAMTPGYNTVYLTCADGQYHSGIDHRGSTEVDQRRVTDEEFGAVFPVYLKGSLADYNGMTGRAEKFGQYDPESIGIEGQEQGESPFRLVSELEDLEDYYDVVNAYLSERKGRGAGKQYTVVSGFIRGTCFADIFLEDEGGKVEQTVHYRYDEPCDPYYTPFHKGPFTIDQEEYGDYPIKWEDVDQDGNQDILICVKTAMKAKCYGCLLYDPETNDYLPCKGFEEILNPNLGCGDLRGTLGGGIEAFYYKYKVTEEFSVELIGYLVKNYLGASCIIQI